jgi:hypothetical protein
LFQQLYQTIKDVLDALPLPVSQAQKESQISVVSIIMPTLERTNEFLARGNSASLPMLKFLDIVLSDIYMVVAERKNKQQQL